MLPTCKQVAEQLSENLDQPVSGLRWLKLKLHLLICVYCRRYAKQLELSSKTIKLLDSNQHKPDDEFKEKMMQRFKDCHCNKDEKS